MDIKSTLYAISTCVVSVIACNNLVQAAGYTIIDLGALGGDDSYGRHLNDSAQVAGYFDATGNGDLHAFLYDGNNMQDIGTLGGTDTVAEGINKDAQVTGWSRISGDSATRAFLYDGSLLNLGTLGGDESSAYGINNLGQVTGTSYLEPDCDLYQSTFCLRHAFIYDSGTLQDLGTLGGEVSFGNDINELGQVTGYSLLPGCNRYYSGTCIYHAFLYNGTNMLDLGTLGGEDSYAYGVNNLGRVVGSSKLSNGVAVAFVYDGQKMQNLCALTDCGSHGWTSLDRASAINDHGDITGSGEINGATHAFLVTWHVEAIDEICTDGIDNDEDGLTDCQDSVDCGQAPLCYKPEGMAYDLIDLGTLGGDHSVGESINNLAQVAGSSVTIDDNTTHAFAYDGGILDLGVLETYDTYSHGYGINDSGQVTGLSGYMGLYKALNSKAFLYDDGIMYDLHELLNAPCNLASRGYDINDSGQVTGFCAYYVDNIWEIEYGHAFFYDGNSTHDLGTLGGEDSYGYGINNQGHVTGLSRTDSNTTHAFLYDGNSMQDLGTLGGSWSAGYAINDDTHVVGASYTTDGGKHAFFYDGNSMQDLGTLGGPSTGRGINDIDQIVGESRLASGETTAFLYDDNRMLYLCRLTDCTSEGWTNLTSASDINDRGDITGHGEINGEPHAFLALSLSDPLPPDPEICDDAIDNDGDGLIDCDDSDDCSQDPFCEVPPIEPEICDDDIDNDGDGLIDCLDTRDCRFDAACKTKGGGKNK